MSEKIKALVFKAPYDVVIEEFPIPDLQDDQILVRIRASSICTWEQRVYTGTKKVNFPFVGGHEMSGEIQKLGKGIDNTHWQIGDKVVIGATLPCRSCYQCKSGYDQNCNYFNHSLPIVGLPYTGMGGLSSHMIVKAQNIFKFDNVSYENAALAEPISCVLNSVETANIQFGEQVVIIGCGIMGLLHTILSIKKGAGVIAVDMNEARLQDAIKYGAQYVINPQKDNVVEKVLEYTHGHKAQVIINTTPIAETIPETFSYLGNNGRMILYSSFYPDKPVTFSPDWLHKSGAALMGAANSNDRNFLKVTQMFTNQSLDVSGFVSEVYELKDYKQAFESAIKGDKYRVVIKF